MGLTEIAGDLQAALRSNMPQIRALLKDSPARAYSRITEIGREAGARHGVRLVVNFPHEGKIEDFGMYGRRDLSIIMDQSRTRFPVGRDLVKKKAAEMVPGCRTEDAYMYEGKEGVKVFMEGGRIDVLPHSLHVWCPIEGGAEAYCNWLMAEVYGRP